jgi:hypothetical protein
MSDVVETLRRLGQPLVYYPALAKHLGDVKTTVFVCYFIHASGNSGKEGWMEVKQKKITEITGLSRYEQEGARTRLTELGILQSTRCGVPARLSYRFYWGELDKLLLSSPVKSTPDVKPLKDDPEVTMKSPALFIRIKNLWNFHYEELYPPYEWSKGKKGGADAGVVSWFMKTFLARVLRNKQKENQTQDVLPVSDDEVVAAFDLFMKHVPKKWKEKNFTLLQFKKYFNNIITDIVNEQKRKNGSSAESSGTDSAGAGRFVTE